MQKHISSGEQRKTKNLNNWGEEFQQKEAATMKGFLGQHEPVQAGC